MFGLQESIINESILTLLRSRVLLIVEAFPFQNPFRAIPSNSNHISNKRYKFSDFVNCYVF